MLRTSPWLVLAPCLVAACFAPTFSPSSTDADPSEDSSGTTAEPGSATAATTVSSTTDAPSSTAAPSTTNGATDPTGDDATGDDTSTGDPSTESATDPSTETATTDDDTTGDAACDGTCAPDVPQGWQGPVVVYDGEAAAPPCPATYPQAVHSGLHAGLEPGDASCSCECGDVVGATCGAATLREEGNFCAQFIMNPDTWALQPNQCNFINAPADTYSLTPPSLNTSNASCSPDAGENIPTPTWDRNVRSCGTAAGDACDGGTCFPAIPEDHAMCIWVEGDAACPGGAWTTRTVSHEGYTDDRECTACSCGSPSGTCGGSAILTNQGCGVIYVDELPANGCGELAAASHAEWYPEVNASCTPSGGALVGDCVPDGAVTYCCM